MPASGADAHSGGGGSGIGGGGGGGGGGGAAGGGSAVTEDVARAALEDGDYAGACRAVDWAEGAEELRRGCEALRRVEER